MAIIILLFPLLDGFLITSLHPNQTYSSGLGIDKAGTVEFEGSEL